MYIYTFYSLHFWSLILYYNLWYDALCYQNVVSKQDRVNRVGLQEAFMKLDYRRYIYLIFSKED